MKRTFAKTLFKGSHSLLAVALLAACNQSPIKNEDAKVVQEEGTEVPVETSSPAENTAAEVDNQKVSTDWSAPKASQYWVGDFRPHKEVDMNGKYIYADEVLGFNRTNKISISIDAIEGDSIIGHSVVAGNVRPFYGTITENEKGKLYVAKEPGDDKYDGVFTFQIFDDVMLGTWEAYKDIEIPKREYKLTPKTFVYDPNIMLDKHGRYGDWNKFINHGTVEEVIDEGTEYEEVYEWDNKEFASSTEKIFEINASNTLLTPEDVENLHNSDLVVIRNSIYARHGYSFKYRPLRVFFDYQSWYIPVHTDIREELTEIEKKNIQLLLKYEKNAKEYYDYFGRG
jgi:hypothetical protein